MKTNNKGFSLVELIVVIAVMAILAAVAIPTFAAFIGKAQVASDESYLNDLEYAVELVAAEKNEQVTSLQVTIASNKVTVITVKTDKDTTGKNWKTDVDALQMLDDYTFKGLENGNYIPDIAKPGKWKNP